MADQDIPTLEETNRGLSVPITTGPADDVDRRTARVETLVVAQAPDSEPESESATVDADAVKVKQPVESNAKSQKSKEGKAKS